MFGENDLMTDEGKTALKDFLNLASDYLKDGHVRVKADATVEKAGIPLAYMVEEPEGFEETAEEPDMKYGDEDSVESSSSVSSSSIEDSLETVAADVGERRAGGLGATRTHTVPGEGSIHPAVMVIGEGPGADEDASGRPFVGRAGQLLDKMLQSIDLTRGKNCYIANMVKCRPPGNRNPGAEEISACYHFLERQIILLKPAIILCAGRVAAQNLLKTSTGINALRGQFAEFKTGELTIPVLPTYHPSAILRDETLKRPAWEDLKLLRARLAEMGL
jgi:DNA polymerase